MKSSRPNKPENIIEMILKTIAKHKEVIRQLEQKEYQKLITLQKHQSN